MFEVSGEDVSGLSDSDLRELVARLARAELRSNNCPVSSVTSGGNQDAPDGGVDVRVECPCDLPKPDFVPRKSTGYQVKKSNMPERAITEEMRPNGVLRKVIEDIASRSGAYVIVSAQGSTADRALEKRVEAMRKALHDLSTASKLHTDFYDRNRLASWINEYHGVAAWIREKLGKPLAGWSSVSAWGGSAEGKSYLSDENSLLIEERSESGTLGVLAGIERLRAVLSIPRKCIRLVGLSGVGKTRLIQALFEQGVGGDPLDSSLALYTDYTTQPLPTARDMARDLVSSKKRAILVVDNCNPQTHSELAALCSSSASQVSLITVEYDVRDDEPENTDVFRLKASSFELVAKWLENEFPHVSGIDRKRIAEFSEGNFRIAGVLAKTIGKGESIGNLKDNNLFERIFWQRDPKDNDLQRAAEFLSLLYSVDVEDLSNSGELAKISSICEIDVNRLYETLQVLLQRGVVQRRGRYCAILPQAISNRLASLVLKKIPSSKFDAFCAALTPRMRKSLSRRIGLLDDSKEAQEIVSRWFSSGGPFGDLFAKEEDFVIVSNAAPAAPEEVIKRFERDIEGASGRLVDLPAWHNRSAWISLMKLIGYDACFFDRVVYILACFCEADSGANVGDRNRDRFQELFHAHLSGTNASPEQRRNAIRRFALSQRPSLRFSCSLAVSAILRTGYFSSCDSHDFGARSRDWGWRPKTGLDVSDWYNKAIDLAIDVMPASDARALVAGNVRSLWHYPDCRAKLDRVANFFIESGAWIEGWLAFRVALRFDGKNMPDDLREQLKGLVMRLQPTDLLNRARAIVLSQRPDVVGVEIEDGEDHESDGAKPWERADQMAREIGWELAGNTEIRGRFISEMLASSGAQRAFNCACGLGEKVGDCRVVWRELLDASRKPHVNIHHVIHMLSGFLCAVRDRDEVFLSQALDELAGERAFVAVLPAVQGWLGVDGDAVARILAAIDNDFLNAFDLCSLAVRGIKKATPEELVILLDRVRKLPGGVEVSIDILHSYMYRTSDDLNRIDDAILMQGRLLLAELDFQRNSSRFDYEVNCVVLACLAGDVGRSATIEMWNHLRAALDSRAVYAHNLTQTIEALFSVQPFASLDAYLLSDLGNEESNTFDPLLCMINPIENIAEEVLLEWLNRDGDTRYPLAGKFFDLFRENEGEKNNCELSPRFMDLLKKAPDKLAFLGDFWDRIDPRGGSGPLEVRLMSRKVLLMESVEKFDETSRAWILAGVSQLDMWFKQFSERKRTGEESFE